MHQAYKRKAGRRKPQSLLPFIRGLGGIRADQPDAGDFRSMDLPRRFLRRKPGQGRMVDDVCSLAIEAGYFPEGASLSDLLHAVDMEFRGLRKCYALADVDEIEPEDTRLAPEPVKRGRGRPPKPEGALVNGPAFRLHPADLERLAELAPAHNMPLRTFARRCFEVGLAQLSGEAF